jgi:hypothetical protein
MVAKMEELLKQEMEDCWDYTTYLIGSMEKTAEKDDGSSRREIFEKELLFRNVYPINPVKLEASKTGMTTNELKEKMIGWISGGKWDLYKEKAREIWLGKTYISEEEGIAQIPGDVDYVKMSDWLTCSVNKGDQPVGTYAEIGIAVDHKIPVYLITNMIKSELPKSLIQLIFASGGEIFENPTQYFNFIDREYSLKRKE